jgi:acetyltransferase-like isoleucine patch superfamily enzyme
VNRRIRLTPAIKEALFRRGVETLHAAGGGVHLPGELRLEAPCSIKWMQIEFGSEVGAFSYAVSGYYFAARIGRYTSIGEAVQIGRQDHPLDWLSTSPFQYLNDKLFAIGHDFADSQKFHAYRSHLVGKVPGTILRPVTIGHDVWVGHGAFIRAGVTVGTGAIIAAGSVVVKDVPPYAIMGGNPARLIRFRLPEAQIEALLRLQWWRFAPWQLGPAPFHRVVDLIPYLEDRLPGLEPYQPGFLTLEQIARDHEA